MRFNFSKQNLTKQKHLIQRLFEILPGLTSWSVLLGMIVISCLKPIIAAVIIIAFDLSWLLRLFYLTIFLVLSYLRLSIEQRTDWLSRVRGIDNLKQYLHEIQDVKCRSIKERISLWFHLGELKDFVAGPSSAPPSKDIYHLVVIPVMKEPQEIIEPGIESLTRQKFDTKQIIVCFALEERADKEVKKAVAAVQEKYRGFFLDFLVILHPDGRDGEARVKGANVSFAAQECASYFQSKGMPFERVIVSCFDADTVVNPDYFSCLTYHFMICPDRMKVSFQPIPVYHNNIWDVPGFARVMETGSSFYILVESTNPEKLVTFSSHSMSFKTLADVGFWPVDMISDDSAIFWKCFIHYDGQYQVIPMYVTVSMDVVSAETWLKTVKNIYKQKRRWAWGVENFPITARAFLKAKNIPLGKKMKYAFKLFEGHVTWATWSFLLTIIGWIPIFFIRQEFSDSVIYYSAPRVTSLIFNLASLSFLITILLSLCLLPAKKMKYPVFKRIGFAFEWLLIPLIATFLSALPALDAQTRLMCGRYLEFWSADKKRNKT